MNFRKISKRFFSFLDEHPYMMLVFFLVLIFSIFASLFNSFFESDEWFHFTYYLPLTQKVDGIFTAFTSTIINAGALSGSQHVIPIASIIYFLNTKFFGMNFVPYAFISLFLHALNSFLIFIFIRQLLYNRENLTKNLFAFLGGIFFAFSPTPMHAVTGAAPFYGQNVLSVTFSLLCVIYFKKAYVTRKRNCVYTSLFFLFCALFSKETSAFLFLLLPMMALIEKRIFPLKFLGKVFIISILIYAFFRFIIPNVYGGFDRYINKWVDNYVSTARESVVDTNTIVSRDRSIHENIYSELAFRAATFPIKMTGGLFIPRSTLRSLVGVVTPIAYPLPGNNETLNRTQPRQFFLDGPGNDLLLYLISICILIFSGILIKRYLNQKKIAEAQTMLIGLAFILLGALPLVMIVLSFPRWGYDTYFDSRLYYNPNVGAAILFPFLLYFIAKYLTVFISKILYFRIPLFLIASVLFIMIFSNYLSIVHANLQLTVDATGYPRKKVVMQLKKYLPELPKRAVFYTETDGLSAYGPLLPFQTSIPQVLSVVYYDKNPLPDSFFASNLLDGKQGYVYDQGRGLGYYNSKKSLASALLVREFSIQDIYGFYYDSRQIKLKNITSSLRSEMKKYLGEAKENSKWNTFRDPPAKMSFKYPPDTTLVKQPTATNEASLLKRVELLGPGLVATIEERVVTPTFTLSQVAEVFGVRGEDNIATKRLFYDNYYYNDALLITSGDQTEYFIKLEDRLLYLVASSETNASQAEIEKILGSLSVSNEL